MLNPSAAKPDPESTEWPILDYLKDELPGYCFDEYVDTLFVRELLEDFPEVDILEEAKRLRWSRNNEPFSEITNPRVVLRNRIARAARRSRLPRFQIPW